MNPHKKLRSHILAALAAMGMACSAQALSITPLSGEINVSRWEGEAGQTNTPAIDAAVTAIIGTFIVVQENATGDVSNATIVYTGPAFNNNPYALLKDGNNEPFWYLFDLAALTWNGTDDLEFSGFWPGQGGISNIRILDGPLPPTGQPGVPDGGATMGLLGLSLLFVEGLRRKLNSA